MIIVERYQFTVTYLGKEFRSVYLLEHCDLIRRAQRHESGSLRGIEPRDSIAQEFSAISFGRSLVIQILNHQYVATIVELRMREKLARHREQRLGLMVVQGFQ